MLDIKIIRTDSPKEKPAKGQKLGFGKIFTDHMFVMNYTAGIGWHDPRVEPFHNISLSPAAMAKTLVICDRREAIRTAILTAPQDAPILLAGKGHETYQIIGKEKRHFDEKEIVAETFKLL